MLRFDIIDLNTTRHSRNDMVIPHSTLLNPIPEPHPIQQPSTSTQHINNSTTQHLNTIQSNTSTIQHINNPTHQQPNTSTTQQPNTTPQHINNPTSQLLSSPLLLHLEKGRQWRT
ncbi:hypothetical protein Pcinc_040741 [Petrolisthes cinctipes]|uniref:Uncharacterized protein n=1 Tax=Petrolisthes cinctipes TaxID=88211 RepID=A0AAE1BKW0_PETCI|nr:hypothetical protein Pcinc_040741 [Petrolisthes cinctipes]